MSALKSTFKTSFVDPVLRIIRRLYFGILIFFEIVLNWEIISYVKYTEIDWVAYMQEVTYFLEGERNYKLIRGDTGPLVYPAGFLHVFSLLYWLTDKGTNIRIGT
jgi:alpha-1,3-mannosyltransferase